MKRLILAGKDSSSIQKPMVVFIACQYYIVYFTNNLYFLYSALPIIQAIKACKSLTCLILEGNTLGVDAAKAIAKALESQPSFQRALWKDAFTGRLKDEIPRALVTMKDSNCHLL